MSFDPSENGCIVSVDSKTNPSLVHIVFTGELAKIPSTSNSRQIAKTKFGRSFIMKNTKHQAKLKLMTEAYTVSLMRAGILPPMFCDELIYCLILLPAFGYRFDSHNYAKVVGDWLELVGVTSNDTYAEIDSRKKTDYPELKFDQYSTEIYLCKRSLVQTINAFTINSMIKSLSKKSSNVINWPSKN